MLCLQYVAQLTDTVTNTQRSQLHYKTNGVPAGSQRTVSMILLISPATYERISCLSTS